jgi:hypothetical protein
MSDSKTLFTTLKMIFSLWPKNDDEFLTAKESLQPFLDSRFDLSDFCSYPIFHFSIFSDAWLENDMAKVLVYDPKDGTYPHLATLVLSDKGTWKLRSFRFLCVTCFGTGMHGEGPCEVCGLTGWGMSAGTLLKNGERFELNIS